MTAAMATLPPRQDWHSKTFVPAGEPERRGGRKMRRVASILLLLLVLLLAPRPGAGASGGGALVRREGVAVGHRQRWELGEAGPGGATGVDVVTVSLSPLIFEAKGFLTEAEADHIVSLATAEGLGDSYTLASTATKDRFRLNDYNKDGVLDVQELILMIVSECPTHHPRALLTTMG